MIRKMSESVTPENFVVPAIMFSVAEAPPHYFVGQRSVRFIS